jgi:hypothetical protein
MLLAHHILRPLFIPSFKSINRTFATMATDHGKWKFNHTMLRVKDPQRSLEYYKFLGLSQINKMSNPDNKFDLYFLGMWYRGLEGAARDMNDLSNLHVCIYSLGI